MQLITGNCHEQVLYSLFNIITLHLFSFEVLIKYTIFTNRFK